MLRKVVFLCGALLLFASASALASFPPIDLTAGQTNVAGIDGSIWSSNITQPTGTGVYQPFLRIQNQGSEEGFNTDFTPFPLDDKSPANYTHSVQSSSLQTITIGPTDYYSFQLDANEQQNGSRSLISLDKLKIYTGSNPALGDLSTLGNPLYDLDAISDQTVFIQTALKPGSGTDDLTCYIPKSFFAGVKPSDYMYFYTQFGLSDGIDPGLQSGATFEEWRTLQSPSTPPPPVVPEPATMVLFGGGILGMVSLRLRKK